MHKLTQKEKWEIRKKMENYYFKNKKFSPLNELEYIFLKQVYMFLTKQILTSDFKKEMYSNYIKLINVCFFPNLEELCSKRAMVLCEQCRIILNTQLNSPWSFIQLNSWNHYQKMLSIVDLFQNWCFNEKEGNFLSEKEFYELLEFMRKEFNKEKIDFNYHIGKWPKKLRKRFNRK